MYHPTRVKAEAVIRTVPLFPISSFASLLLTIGDQEDDWTIGYSSGPEQEAGRAPRLSSWIKKRAPGLLSIISQVYWENHMGGGPAKLYSAVGRQRGVLDVCAPAEKQSSRDYSCTMVHGFGLIAQELLATNHTHQI